MGVYLLTRVNLPQLEDIYRLYYDALLCISSTMQGQLKMYSFCIGIFTTRHFEGLLPHLCTCTCVTVVLKLLNRPYKESANRASIYSLFLRRLGRGKGWVSAT